MLCRTKPTEKIAPGGRSHTFFDSRGDRIILEPRTLYDVSDEVFSRYSKSDILVAVTEADLQPPRDGESRPIFCCHGFPRVDLSKIKLSSATKGPAPENKSVSSKEQK